MSKIDRKVRKEDKKMSKIALENEQPSRKYQHTVKDGVVVMVLHGIAIRHSYPSVCCCFFPSKLSF